MGTKPDRCIDRTTIASLVEEHVAGLVHTLRPDYHAALEAAVALEKSERGREVLEQLLANASIAAGKELPLCQDTGLVWVCLEVAGDICIPANVFSGVDDAVARAAEASGMRMSILQDALVNRTNTNTNTPVLCELVIKGSHSERSEESSTFSAQLHIMLKGGGSDNASTLVMLPPGAGVEGVLDFVVEAVAAKGANACPPLVIGVGVGGSFDKVASLSKRALLRKVGSIHPNAEIAALEEMLLARINALGIGPGGLGGSTTALAVHIKSAACHIASLPVAVNIGCTALRSVSIPLL